MTRRLISLRACNAAGMLVGASVRDEIEGFFSDPTVAYLQLHNASKAASPARSIACDASRRSRIRYHGPPLPGMP